MFILYVDTTSMYSYQKLTGHKLCQFLQYEGYYNIFFFKRNELFFFLYIYQVKRTFLHDNFYLYFPFSKTENCFDSFKSNFGNFKIFIFFCLKEKIYILKYIQIP